MTVFKPEIWNLVSCESAQWRQCSVHSCPIPHCAQVGCPSCCRIPQKSFGISVLSRIPAEKASNSSFWGKLVFFSVPGFAVMVRYNFFRSSWNVAFCRRKSTHFYILSFVHKLGFSILIFLRLVLFGFCWLFQCFISNRRSIFFKRLVYVTWVGFRSEWPSEYDFLRFSVPHVISKVAILFSLPRVATSRSFSACSVAYIIK